MRFLALVIALVLAGGTTPPQPAVKFGRWQGGVKGCVIADNEVGTVFVGLSSTVQNSRDRPMIVARRQQTTSTRAAESREAGELGKIEASLDFQFVEEAIPRPRLGSAPDARFSIVKPGSTLEVQLFGTVVMRRSTAKVPDTVPAGQIRAVQVAFSWGEELFNKRESEVRDLRGAWREYGDLVTGEASSDWVLIRLPAFEECTVSPTN